MPYSIACHTIHCKLYKSFTVLIYAYGNAHTLVIYLNIRSYYQHMN